MRIYVLNATGQNQVFNYRFDFLVDSDGRKMVGNPKPYRTLNIPARTQVQLGGDWDPVQSTELVQQLERPAVGGVHVSAIKTAKAAGLVRLVWSQDKTIPRAICDDVYQHNIAYLAGDGDRRRKQMALANSATTDAAIGQVASGFAIELETVDEGSDSVSPSLTAGYRVNKQAPKAAAPKRAGRRG